MLTRESLLEILKEAADADKAPEALLKLRDEGEKTFVEFDKLNQEAEALRNKVAELRDTNHRLFLRQTGEQEKPEEKEPETPEEALAALIEKIGGNENDN